MRCAWALATATDTMRLGSLLARACPWGAREPRLLFLSGELGAGKTTLAAGLLEALGVDEAVRSPSYTLIETYPLRLGLAVHVDLYRLRGPEELEPLALRDYFAPNTLLLIEWPERAVASLPRPDLAVHLQASALESGRVCRIEAHSGAGEAWLAVVEQQSPSQTLTELGTVSH
jgi:tRNA threonylcarbamoyladenosine biosynthesis protein TsaE